MFCPKCGAQNEDQAKFCSGCAQSFQQDQQPTEGYSYEQDVQQNKAMAIISYFIFFIPLIAAKESRFARYHANQGLILLLLAVCGGIVLSLLSALLWFLFPIMILLHTVFSIAIFVLLILGIVNTVNGKMAPLPVIGSLFTLIK